MNQVTKKPLISADERARRQAAIDYARGSVRLEGVALTAETEELNKQFVDGEITSEEHSQAIRKLYGA